VSVNRSQLLRNVRRRCLKTAERVWALRYFFEMSSNSLFRKNLLQSGEPILVSAEIRSWKMHNTLVVLGNAPTINNLSQESWDFINTCDSMGLNFFFVHPFQPIYAHIEIPTAAGEETSFLLKERYRNSCPPLLMMNWQHAQWAGFHRDMLPGWEVRWIHPVRFRNASVNDLKRLMLLHGRIGHHFFPNASFHHGGSLSSAISLGLLMGYKRIVLVGVELMGNNNFYADQDRFPTGPPAKLRKMYDKFNWNNEILSSGQKAGHVHRTADKRNTLAYGEQSIVDVIDALCLLATQLGATIEVGSPTSLLARFLPLRHEITYIS
jgi:hypothetical protein